MNIAKRTDYALRALFTLVEAGEKGPLSIRELARRNDAPKRFLEHIMLDLKSKGWVASLPGRHGGYYLGKPASQITMGEVVRYFNGTLAPIECVSVSAYKKCSQEAICRFRRVFLEARNHVTQVMDSATLAEVSKGPPVTTSEVFSAQFIDGGGI